MSRPLAVLVDPGPDAFADALTAAIAGDGPAVLPRASAGADAGAVPVPATVADGVALVVETSGSTGRPKRVAIGADALTASTAGATAALGAGAWLLALPTHYIAGINVLLRSTAAGFAPTRMPPGGFTAAGFVATAERMPAGRSRLVSLVPAQLQTLLDDPAATTVLAGFDTVLVGGQRTPPALAARAGDAGIRLVRSYGSSETCGGCVYDGEPMPGVVVEADAAGEVLVGGAVLAAGYLGDPARTDAAFTGAGAARRFRTGDLGSVADGVLAITGRVDDVIVSGGVNVALGAVERVVQSLPALAGAVVVAGPSPRWGDVPVVVADGRPRLRRPDLAEVRAAVATELGRAAQPDRILWLDAGLPLLASGKPDRVALRALVAEAAPADERPA